MKCFRSTIRMEQGDDKLNGAYDFRDRLEKLYVIAEAFKERYGIKSDYSED